MTARLRIAVVVLVVLAVLVAVVAGAPAAAAPPPPAVSAPGAIVVEASTGAVAYAKNADARYPIASATKLMTALLTLERARLADDMLAAAYRPLAVESRINLQPGERLTVADLLRGLLLESANDAAVTLAEGVGGSRVAFVRAMNARARELGLTRTRFVDPIGIGGGNRSSARDLAVLTRELRRFRFFRRTVARSTAVLASGTAPRRIANRNTLVGLPLVDGVKTGRTLQAGWVLVGSGRRGSGERRVRVISVVLSAPSEAARNEDTLALLRWGVRRFKVAVPVREGRRVARLPILRRGGAELPVVAGRGVRVVVPRDRRLVARVTGLPAGVEGPLRAGRRLGTIEVYDGSRRVAAVPAVAGAAVPAATLAERTKESLGRPLTIGVAIAALAGSVLLARMGTRRRQHRTRRTRKEPGVA